MRLLLKILLVEMELLAERLMLWVAFNPHIYMWTAAILFCLTLLPFALGTFFTIVFRWAFFVVATLYGVAWCRKNVLKNYAYFGCCFVLLVAAIATPFGFTLSFTVIHNVAILALLFIPKDDDDNDGGTRRRIKKKEQELDELRSRLSVPGLAERIKA